MDKQDYLVMNWADDVNYMFSSMEEVERAIETLKEVSESLRLPFSRDKCKLVPIYPRKYSYKDREKIGDVIKDLVTVSKGAKILGVTWSQPRFRLGRPYMFRENADEVIKKIKEVQIKMKRIKMFGIKMSNRTQRIV